MSLLADANLKGTVYTVVLREDPNKFGAKPLLTGVVVCSGPEAPGFPVVM